jgi:hypothetical protein
VPKAGAAGAKPRTQAAAQRQARRAPDKGPACYRARVYHEIEQGDGVLRVEPGHVVVGKKGAVEVMPPEIFAARHPGVTAGIRAGK